MTTRLPGSSALLPLIVLFACEHAPPTDPVATRGAMLDTAYLATVDGAALPCCAEDSSELAVRVVAGTLTFYRSAHYTDSAFVPAGFMVPVACVREVPNGSFVMNNGLVRYGGALHLLLPCSEGIYDLRLVEEVRYPDGTSRTISAVVSTGTFAQGSDTLALADFDVPSLLVATTSDSTITVTSPWHQYRLEVPCGGPCGP